MKSSVALTAGAAVPLPHRAQAANKPLLAYVGTYSSPLQDVPKSQVDLPAGNGRGIHLFEVDRASGALSPRGVVEQPASPSCLVINAAGTRIYSTNETYHSGDDDSGTLSAFAIDREDGQLKLINSVTTDGAGPTYVSLHPSGRFAFVANYFGGSLSVFPILADGSLGELSDLQQDAGKPGPRKATNAPPGSFAFSGHERTHAHMIAPDPAGRFVISVDLGLDKILVWKFDARAGKLSPNDPPSVSLPPGDGAAAFRVSSQRPLVL